MESITSAELRRYPSQSIILSNILKSLIFSRYFLQSLHNIWQTKSLITGLLLPLSLLFWMVSVTRRFLYQKKILKSVNFDIPIIVVGNITVGGTGKTPVVIWLTNFLKQKGFKVGVLCSGYKKAATLVFLSA